MLRNIFLIVGPSGAGKTSLTNALISIRTGLKRAITVTTRQPRLGEVDGKDYIFVSQEKFEEMKVAGEFFETDSAFGESYGIPRDFDKQQGDLIFIITLAGARTVKRAYPEAKTVLILPTSIEGARQRVIERQAPNQNERINGYETEYRAAMTYAREVGFEAVIENDHFQDALRELEGVCMRRRTSPVRKYVRHGVRHFATAFRCGLGLGTRRSHRIQMILQ